MLKLQTNYKQQCFYSVYIVNSLYQSEHLKMLKDGGFSISPGRSNEMAEMCVSNQTTFTSCLKHLIHQNKMRAAVKN